MLFSAFSSDVLARARAEEADCGRLTKPRPGRPAVGMFVEGTALAALQGDLLLSVRTSEALVRLSSCLLFASSGMANRTLGAVLTTRRRYCLPALMRNLIVVNICERFVRRCKIIAIWAEGALL